MCARQQTEDDRTWRHHRKPHHEPRKPDNTGSHRPNRGTGGDGYHIGYLPYSPLHLQLVCATQPLSFFHATSSITTLRKAVFLPKILSTSGPSAHPHPFPSSFSIPLPRTRLNCEYQLAHGDCLLIVIFAALGLYHFCALGSRLVTHSLSCPSQVCRLWHDVLLTDAPWVALWRKMGPASHRLGPAYDGSWRLAVQHRYHLNFLAR